MSNRENPPPYSAPEPSTNTGQGTEKHPRRVQLQPVHTGEPGVPVTNVQVVTSGPMQPRPAVVICQTCNQQVLTKTEGKASMKTHLWACCCFVTGLWPCIVLNYCSNDLKSVIHTCPNCGAYVGST